MKIWGCEVVRPSSRELLVGLWFSQVLFAAILLLETTPNPLGRGGTFLIVFFCTMADAFGIRVEKGWNAVAFILTGCCLIAWVYLWSIGRFV